MRRKHGNARIAYAAVRKVVLLPVLRRCLRICASDVCRLELADGKRAARIPKSFVVRMANLDDLEPLAAYYDDRQLVSERFQRGDLCVITLCQDAIGAAVWLSFGPGEFREDWDQQRYTCCFPAGTGWSYDGRGTKWGAWGAMMAKLPELVRERDVDELWTMIDCNNWKSLDAHRSLGYETIGIVGSAGLFGLVRSICKRPRQWWHPLPARMGTVEFVNRLAGG